MIPNPFWSLEVKTREVTTIINTNKYLLEITVRKKSIENNSIIMTSISFNIIKIVITFDNFIANMQFNGI